VHLDLIIKIFSIKIRITKLIDKDIFGLLVLKIKLNVRRTSVLPY